MAEINPNSRMNLMRSLKVGETFTLTELLPEEASILTAKDTCKRMTRTVGSTLNFLRHKEGLEFERSTLISYLSSKGRIACMLIIERTK